MPNEDKLDQLGRDVPTRSETKSIKQTFRGKGGDRYREIPWKVGFLNTGQFIQFQYNNKQRRVLVLSPVHSNTAGNSVLTAIELNEIAFAPQKLAQLFKIGSLPRVVRIDSQDDDGFRYFSINVDLQNNPMALYELLQAKNKTINKHYKTYFYDKLKTGVIKMFNPIFSPYVVSRMTILGEE
jgi:hypothetical protein